MSQTPHFTTQFILDGAVMLLPFVGKLEHVVIDMAVELERLVYLEQVGRLPNERDGGIHLMTAQLGILVPGWLPWDFTR